MSANQPVSLLTSISHSLSLSHSFIIRTAQAVIRADELNKYDYEEQIYIYYMYVQ